MPDTLKCADAGEHTLNISFEEAVTDSPYFRSSVNQFSDELDELERWLDSILVTNKLYIESFAQVKDAAIAISRRIVNYRCAGLITDFTTMRTVSESIVTLTTMRQKLASSIRAIAARQPPADRPCVQVESIQERVIAGIQNLIIKTIKEVKEAYVLFEARQAHIKASLDYVAQIIVFKYNLDGRIPEMLLGFTAAHSDYLDAGWEMFRGMQPASQALRARLDMFADTKEMTLKELGQQIAVEAARPKPKDNADAAKPPAKQAPEREGYLFRKSVSGSTWLRRYFMIRKGGFSYATVATSGRHRGKLMVTTPISVLLCNARPAKADERRFCFEVQTKSFLLQAESDEDARAWISSFEAAKYALATSATPVLDMIDQGAFEPSSEDESDGGETLHQIKIRRQSRSTTQRAVHVEGSEAGTESEVDTTQRSQSSLRDIVIQGRMYITPHRVCFYANIFGFVTLLSIRFKEVTSIVKKNGSLHGNIQIATAEATHIFKMYGKPDRVHTPLTRAWNNAQSATPVSAQELHNQSVAVAKGGTDKDGISVARRSGEEGDGVGEAASNTALGDSSSGGAGKTGEYKPPDSVTLPTAEVQCGCKEHLEKKEVDVVLNAPAKKIFDLLFGDKSARVWEQLDKRRGGSKRQEGVWNEFAEPSREISYTLAMNNPMVKVKEADVKEAQTLIKKTEWISFSMYIVEAKTSTPQLPFGDCFNPMMRYCITWVTEDTCRLALSIGINFCKSTMMKSVIKSAGLKGLAETCADIVSILQAEISGGKAATSGFSPRMREFLDLAFGITVGDSTAALPAVLQLAPGERLSRTFSDPELAASHATLTSWHASVREAREDVLAVSRRLDDFERHVVWAMYFNWLDDGIQSRCTANGTSVSDPSLPCLWALDDAHT
nr:SNF1-interacting protein [Polyrhizophydium stewartii]